MYFFPADKCRVTDQGKESGTVTLGTYKANQNCQWLIVGPVGTKLALTVRYPIK